MNEMSTPELQKYIKDSLDKGSSKEEIKKSLIDRGWDHHDVEIALNMNDSDNLIPAPPSGSSSNEYRHLSNPLNSIVYIISFLLILTVIYSGMLAFGVAVDYYFAPQTDQNVLGYYSTYDTLYQTMTLSLATFIISLPIYLLTVWFLRSDENKRPIIRKSWSRKGSAFIVILFTFGYCLGSLIWIVYTTITQQVSSNDLIKFSVYFILNLLPLVYYFMQLKDDKKYVK